MAKARIEKYNGEPAIMIEGKAYPPMSMTAKSTDREYFKKIGDTGIRIFYITAYLEWPVNGVCKPVGHMNVARERIRAITASVPDAYIILRMSVNPSAAWINAHPEEQLLFSDGTHEPVICDQAAGGPIDGMMSFASQKWREDATDVIKNYLKEFEGYPEFERVIGFFFCAGGTGEWYYPGVVRMHNDAKGTYADLSEPFRKWYSAYLKRKYGTEEELRRAWKRPNATFDAPIIPNLEDRVHTHKVDEEIARGLRDWEDYERRRGINGDAKMPGNVGVFLNVDEYMHTADFFAALHEATADAIIFFGTLLKQLKPDMLTGAFYGYFGCTDYYDASHCTGALTIMNSGVIDFLAAPGTYNNREPGGVVAQREMQDSLRIRNKMFISEDDSRTHHCLPLIQRETMAIYTVEDAINTLKRDFARNICEDIHGWWFDMGICDKKDPWYTDPEILNLFSQQQEIGQFAYSLDRTKKNEIAVLYDHESVHMVSDSTNQLALDFFRTSDLHRIGAPIDYYFHNDMSNPDMPDYKLYIALNAYCLTDEEREAIYAKARKNHATVLWMYAPGLINTKAEQKLAAENVEKTVGMKVEMVEKTMFPWFRVDPETHFAVNKAKAEMRYGYIDRNVHSNLWVTPTVLPPVSINPGFVIKEDENVTVLGRYCCDGRPAYAMREDLGFTSAYCCAQVIRSELIASLAEYAGCHIYTDSEDVLYANENLVAIHASYTGKRRIRFPQPCSPYEVYEKKYYGENVEYIDLDMKLGETKMFYKEMKK